MIWSQETTTPSGILLLYPPILLFKPDAIEYPSCGTICTDARVVIIDIMKTSECEVAEMKGNQTRVTLNIPLILLFGRYGRIIPFIQDCLCVCICCLLIGILKVLP